MIDRQFFREKYKFDRAMQKMKLAVGSLIDRVTLGRRLLEAASEVLRLEWGALYLARRYRAGRFSSWPAHGPTPDERALAPDNPLVTRLRRHAHGAAFARDGARRRVGPGHRRDDRAGRRGRRRRWGATAIWPGFWCSAPSAAACRTKTKRWRFWGR